MEIVRFLLFPLLLGKQNDSWKSSQSSHLLSYVSKFTKGNDGLLLYVANDNWMPSGIPANVTWLSWELSLPSVGIRVCVCVCEREKTRDRRERESRRRGMHVSGGTLIRSDSSITGSYTCDKSGTRSLGERRLKAVKMEFEWHPGDRVCIYDLISTFLSDSTLPRSQFCVTAPSFVKFYPELEVYRIRDLSVGNCLEEGTVTSLANSYKCNNSPTNCTSNPTQKWKREETNYIDNFRFVSVVSRNSVIVK